MRRAYLALLTVTLAIPATAVMTKTANGEYALPGTTYAAQPDLAGTVLSDTIVPFSAKGTKGANAGKQIAHGTMQIRVVRNKAGFLAFYWKVNNAADSIAPVFLLDVQGFPLRVYDANWRIDGLGTIGPDKLYIQSAESSFGPTYSFWFKGKPLPPGQSSRFVFLKTNATKIAAKKGRAYVSPLDSTAPPIEVPVPE